MEVAVKLLNGIDCSREYTLVCALFYTNIYQLQDHMSHNQMIRSIVTQETWNSFITGTFGHSSVSYSVTKACQGLGLKTCWSPEFFRLLYPWPIAKIAFTTVRIIVSHNFVSAIQYNYDSFHIYHFMYTSKASGSI